MYVYACVYHTKNNIDCNQHDFLMEYFKNNNYFSCPVFT